MERVYSLDAFHPLIKRLTSIYELDNGLNDNRQTILNQFQGFWEVEVVVFNLEQQQSDRYRSSQANKTIVELS